jgi:aspartyl-tRNA(Asn)/glutamyl-tRNA(Gln) amidotransferase subunit C
MSVDENTVHRIARLARIAVPDSDVPALAKELNVILDFVAELNELDTENVTPMTSVVETEIKRREDNVTDGGMPDEVTANAPVNDDNYFAVPKVVE